MSRKMLLILSVMLLVAVSVFAQYEPPTNLTAEVNETTVNLSWMPPATGEVELIYDNDTPTDGYTYVGNTMSIHMSPAEACQVLTLKYYTTGSGDLGFNAEVYDWDGTAPSTTQLHTEAATGADEQWVEVDVSDENLMVDGDFVVGFGSINSTCYLGFDANLDNGRSWDLVSGSWSQWNEAYHIRAIVLYGDGRTEELEPVLTRDITGYMIYRDGTDIAEITDPSNYDYADTGLAAGTYVYYVTAIYDGTNESDPSNTAEATVLPVEYNPPQNLTATVNGSNVVLQWEAPEVNEPDVLRWDNGENNDAIGLTNGGTFSVAARFTPTELAEYDGWSLSQVEIYINDAPSSLTLKVWTGGSWNGTTGSEGTEVVSEVLTDYTTASFNLITLPTPIAIDASEELWIGYDLTHAAGDYAAGCDAGPQENYYGNLILNGGSWASLSDLASSLTYNWNIGGFVVNARGEHIALGATTAPAAPFNTADLAACSEVETYSRRVAQYGVEITRDRPDVEGYNIYRDETFLGSTSSLFYTDLNLDSGNYEYYVTAVYSDGGESEASNTANATGNNDGDVWGVVNALGANTPNPFNPTTEINFSIAQAGHVTLDIYNVRGQLVKTLFNNTVDAGEHSVVWNGDDNNGASAASGIYFYKMKSGRFTATKKMILLK